MRIFICLLLLVATSIAFTAPSVAAEVTIGAEGRPLPLDEVIAIVMAHDAARECATFSVTVSFGHVTGVGESESFTKNASRVNEMQVWYCPQDRRYRVQGHSLMQAITVSSTVEGSRSILSSHFEMGSNGSELRAWRKGYIGNTEAERAAASPLIDAVIVPVDRNGAQVEVTGFGDAFTHNIALAWISPYVYPMFEATKPLSVLLEEKRAAEDYIACYRVGDRDVGIHYISEKSTSSPYEIRLRYNPAAGRLEAAEWGRSEVGKPDAWTCAYKATFEYPDGDAWIPTTVFLSLLLYDRDAIRWDFADVVYEPMLAQAALAVEFPVGVEVTDYVRQMVYLTGGSSIDEDKAVQDFMAKYRFSDANREAAAAPDASKKMVVILAVNVVAILLLAGFVLWRRSRSYGGGPGSMVAIVFSVLLIPVASKAESPSSHQAQPHPQMRQCGHVVAYFVFKRFGIDYSIEHVVDALPPSERGISLLDLKHCLSAHGLNIVARTGLSRAEIGRIVADSGTLAIIPVKMTSGRGHYYIVGQDDEKRLLLIDVPYSVRPLHTSISEEQIRAFDGTALFVSPPKHPVDKDGPSSLDVTPATVDLGEFDIDTDAAAVRTSHRVALRNRGRSAVLIDQVVGTCGCVAPLWNGGVIPPEATQMLEFSVLPSAFGEGNNSKPITIVPRVGDPIIVHVTGTGRSAAALQRVTAIPEVPVDITRWFYYSSEAGDDADSAIHIGCPWEVQVRLIGEPSLRLHCEGESSAIRSCRLQCVNHNTLYSRFASGRRILFVPVTDANTGDVIARLRLERQPLVTVSAVRCVVEKEATHCHIPLDVSKGHGVSIQSTSSRPKGIGVELLGGDEGVDTSSTSFKASIAGCAPGLYVVLASVKTSHSQYIEDVRFIVEVRDTPK